MLNTSFALVRSWLACLKAKAAITDQVAFKARTLEQWNSREKACHDRECLARWYADQRIVLQHIVETGNAAAE
jgi:hypothetical protein